jgi:predicted DNA-binding protein (UPF0251 family)
MPRHKQLRKVVAPPGFRGYRPYGAGQVKKDPVELLYEEYEALKLADYDLMDHQEASVLMGVSRPTFARIYKSARRKIAGALVESREIRSVFGNARLDNSWFLCDACHARFTIPHSMAGGKCPVCRSSRIHPINQTI